MLAIFAAVGLVGLFVAALAVPVELRVRAILEDELDAGMRVGWLFGLVEREVEPGERRREKTRRSLPSREKLELLLNKPLRRRVSELFERCRPAVELEVLTGRARIGLGDPAETGQMLGVLQPIIALLSRHPSIELRIEPDWTRAWLTGALRGEARVVPLGLVGPIVRFAVSREAIGTVRAWRRASS